MSNYLYDVRRYDAGADADVVKKIVRYLGIALYNPETVYISCCCSDELQRLRARWCKRKLGETDDEICDAIITTVCKTMKADRYKARVTFYYLIAKHMGALEDL